MPDQSDEYALLKMAEFARDGCSAESPLFFGDEQGEENHITSAVWMHVNRMNFPREKHLNSQTIPQVTVERIMDCLAPLQQVRPSETGSQEALKVWARE